MLTFNNTSRRSFLRVGSLGIGGVTLPNLLRQQAQAAEAGQPVKKKSVILVWLAGGPSHLDMYDLKPHAPAEIRGEFRPVPTNVSGIEISEHLPRQACLMDKLAIVRSAFHTNAGHGMGSQWMMTGYQPTLEVNDNIYPSIGSIVARTRGANDPAVPAYVNLPKPVSFGKAAYLGASHNPFSPESDPNSDGFQVRNLKLPGRVDLARMHRRRGLLSSLDTIRRDIDLQGDIAGLDSFYRDGLDMVTNDKAIKAFDIKSEEAQLRDFYGRNDLGQSCLLARRLVEAGVTFVAVQAGGGWDTHGDNFKQLKDNLLPKYDQAVSALVQDVFNRGLQNDVLVMSFGEFGRTPKINPGAGRVASYLEMRFGPKARLLGAVLYLYMRFLWMGAIIYSASLAIAQITQDTAPGAIAALTGGTLRFDERSWFYFVLISTGAVSTAYTVMGGISAVIWTDVVQMVILFLGAVVTLIVVVSKTGTGPLVWWKEVTSISHEFPALASWNLSQRTTILWTLLGVFFWQVCTHASDQVALQRYFSNVDVRSARKTAMVGIILDITMQTLLGMVGAALLVYYMRNPDRLPAGVDSPMTAGFSDRIFPHFINYGLPVGISGFVVAALFAVAQSSIDSGINATTSVIMIDLVRRYRRNQSSEAKDLKLAKILTVFIGVVVTLMGVVLSLAPKDLNLIDLQLKSFNCVLGPLGAMFMAGMLLRHVGQTPVIIAGITGAVCGLMFGFMDVLLTPIFKMLTGNEASVVSCPSPFLVIPLSWLVTFTLSSLLAGFFPGPTLDQVRRFTWAGIFYGSKDNV